METRDDVKSALRTVSLVGVSISVSLFIYLAIAEIIRIQFRPFRGFAAFGDTQRIRYAFFAGAIVAVILIRILRQSLLRKRQGETAPAALRRIQRAALITLVLGEVPAVLGLILFLLFGFNIDFYLLLFVSMVLVFMYFPRLSHWQDMLKD